METKPSIGQLVKAIFITVIIIFIIVLSAEYLKYLQKIKLCTKTTYATVLVIKNTNPKAIGRIVTYEYLVSETKYVSMQNLSISVPRTPFLNIGDKIIVCYDPFNPQNATALRKLDFFIYYLMLFAFLGLGLYDGIRSWSKIKAAVGNQSS